MPRNECPPDHTEYLSRMLAENAATLHSFIHPECPGIQAFRCQDHFHIGHRGNDKALCPPSARPAYPRPKPKSLKARKRRSGPP